MMELKLIDDKGEANACGDQRSDAAVRSRIQRSAGSPGGDRLSWRMRRQGTRAQKDRSEVKHSTKKPWRQKGTGRARAGMASSPLWRGGGRIFPNTPDENFSHKLNRKMYRAGMCSILSQLAREGRLAVVEEFALDAAEDQAARAEGQGHGFRRRADHHRRRSTRTSTFPRATCPHVIVVERRPCRPGEPDPAREGAAHAQRDGQVRGVAGMSAPAKAASSERLMQVLLAPVVSEKSTFVADKNNQVVFRVHRDATKPEIKAAVELCSRSRSRACRSPTSRARSSASGASWAAGATGRRRTSA